MSGCAYYNTYYNAEKIFREAEKEFKKLPDEKVTTALKKKFDAAIEKSNKVITQYPDSRWVDDSYYIIAMSHYYKGDYRIARQKFEEFAVKFPQSKLYPEAMVWYGRNLWKLDERELAFFQWKKIMNRTDDYYLLAELYVSIGELYFKDSAYDSALFYYQKATEVGKSFDIAAEAQFRIAEIDLALNRPQEAIKNLKKIDQLSPSLLLRDKMQVLLVRIYRESGQYDKAVDLINEKLNDQANEKIWGDLELQLGLIYLAQQDYDAAISRFTQVVEKYKGKPVAADASYYLAELYMTQIHDYAKAAAQYDNVVKIETNTLRAFECRNKSSEIKRFNTIYNRLTVLNEQIANINLNPPTGSDTLTEIIKVDQEQSELKKALEKKNTTQKKAIDTLAVFKEYYNSLYEIAEIFYFNFNQPDSAIYYFEKVAYEIPFNSLRDKALYSLYRICTDQHNLEKAKEYADQLRQLFPESEYLAEIEKRPPSISARQVEADSLLIKAENLDQTDLHSAIAIYEKLAKEYSECQTAEKAVMYLAYIYHHRLYDLNNALTWYKYYLDTYPKGQYYTIMKSAYDQLKNIESTLAKGDQDEKNESQKPEKAE
ncbi:MAG TPA: tetratricopeptide repeat protein [Candidatus Marinimicrobia bacterium]|nr:tetratricopeptide repeat protein [Candidatus Neomarinimicrobiota bacterium]HRS51595.1 tetratricopeptide repeat protein [Candidatus Neomarinimicrobiota bacterium]HRU92327.1 tetratricopeptide repeat protein [Candidatus Neomarinimicrobiota bacterium]